MLVFTVCWSAFSSVLPPPRFPVTFSKRLPTSGRLVTAGRGPESSAEEGGVAGGGRGDHIDFRVWRATDCPHVN